MIAWVPLSPFCRLTYNYIFYKLGDDMIDDQGNDWALALDGPAATAILTLVERDPSLIEQLSVRDSKDTSGPKTLAVNKQGGLVVQDGEKELPVAEHRFRFRLTEGAIQSLCDTVRRSVVEVASTPLDEYQDNRTPRPTALRPEVPPLKQFQTALAEVLEEWNSVDKVIWETNRIRFIIPIPTVLRLQQLAFAVNFSEQQNPQQPSRYNRIFVRGNDVANCLEDTFKAAYKWDMYKTLQKQDPTHIGAYGIQFVPDQGYIVIFNKAGANHI